MSTPEPQTRETEHAPAGGWAFPGGAPGAIDGGAGVSPFYRNELDGGGAADSYLPDWFRVDGGEG